MSAPSPAASGTSLLEPVDVRCEYLTDPLGIDVARPRLSWALRGGVRGERQSSYRVIVASTVERALAGSADLWDTGKVPDQSGDLGSVATLAVEYDGPALESGQRAWWTVQVWNAAGEPAGTSAPASWEMGLLAESDWQAVWIGRDDPMPPKEPPPPATGPVSCGRGRSSICAPPPTCAARSSCPGRWRAFAGRGCGRRPAASTSCVLMGNGRAMLCWPRVGAITGPACATRPTMSARCCATAPIPWAQSWARAGTPATSAGSARPRSTDHIRACWPN